MNDEGKRAGPPPVPRNASTDRPLEQRRTPARGSGGAPPPIPAPRGARGPRAAGAKETSPPRRAAPRSRPRNAPEVGEDDPTVSFSTMPASAIEDPARTHKIERVEQSDLSPRPEADELFAGLRDVCLQELRHLPEKDHRTRAVLLFELGHLDEIVDHDAAGALSRYEESFKQDRTFIPAMRALRRLYAVGDRWQDALEALRAEVDVTGDDEHRSGLLTQMGELLATRLADMEGAIKSLRASIALTPRRRRAADLLREIYARQDRWEDLLEVLRGITNVTGDDVERARLMVEMAEVCEHRLGRPEDAEELYAQALVLDPSSEAATVALRRIYPMHRRWKGLRELLAAEAGRDHDPDERFADLYRAARISEIHLQDDVQAASLLETAAALRPADPLPLQSLIALNHRMGRYDEQAAAISRQLRLVRDSADRAALCYQLGRVQEDWLDRPEESVRAYREALKEQPGHEASLRALAHLFETFERWEDLLDLELLRAERSKDVSRRADGYVRAAAISETHVKDLRRAVDLYDRAYRMVPGLPEAFRALERIYRRSGQWEPLAELYEQQASISQDKGLGLGLLRAAARLWEEALNNRERAVVALERLQERSPEDREALIHLARLHEEAGRVEDLRKILERWAEVTEDDQERTELSRRIGELLEGPLRRTEQAVEVYQGILERVSSDRPTIERLKAIFERTGRWSELVNVFRAELETIQPGPEQAPLLIQVGQVVRDKLGDLEQAQTAFEEALKVDPNHTPAMLALQDLLRGQGAWDKLVDLYNATADRIREPVRAAATLCGAGEICEEQLQDTEQAEQFYNRALELDPGNGPAKHGLERLYLAAMDRGALESHYLREAEGTANPLQRLRAYLRLGALFSGPGNDPVGATAAYESALRVIDDQPDALRSLAGLLRRTMGWERLAGLLARIAGTSNEREAAVGALKEWGSIVELHLADKWDPAPIYERILDGAPYDQQALFALTRIAYQRGDRASLISLAQRQVQADGDPEHMASLCTRAATLLVEQGDAQSAAETLRRGLQASPGYLPAIQLLRRLDEQLEEWAEAGDLLLREGELLSTPELARAALVRGGNILLDRFGDVPRARRAFERVFAEDPGHAAAFGRLANILSVGEEWPAMVAAYQRRMEVVDPTARIPLQMDLASLYRDNLRDATAAIEVLQELLSVDPAHRQALAEISELCSVQNRWREAEGYLEQLSDVARDDPETVRDALLQRCHILEDQLGEEDRALEVLERILGQFPRDREALEHCLAIYKRRGNWEKTVEVLEEMVHGGSISERVDGLVDMAELYSRTLNDPDGADAALRRAASACVETGEGVDRITEYYERRGDFEGLVDQLGLALDELPPEGSPGSVSVRLARARILAGRLLQPSEAEIEIRKALQSEPDSISARLELAGLHLWGDNLGEATTEYMRVLDQEPFSVDAFRGLYRVYDRRGDVERSSGAAQAVAAVAGVDVPERKIAAQATAPMEAALSSAMATPLGVHDFWNLLAHHDEPQVARELLYMLADYLPTILSHEVDMASAGSIIPLAPDDPLAGRCSQLAQVMGVDRLEVCLGQNRPSIVQALPGTPPRLVVDDTFASRASAGEFRYAVGRSLAEILTRSLYLSTLRPRSVELVLAAVTSLFERGYGDHLNQGREVDELAKVVSRAIPRKVRKQLEEPARSYAAGQPAVPKAWAIAARRSSERAGLLLSGDVEAALRVLRREKASRAVQAELLRFTVGPHLYEARRRLGLSI